MRLAVGLVSFLLGCTKANFDYCEKTSDCPGGRVCNLERKACLSPDAAVGPLDSAGDVGVEMGRVSDAPYASEASAIDAALVLDGKVDSNVAGNEAGHVDGNADGNVDGNRIEKIDSAPVDGPGPDLFVIVIDAAGTCGVNSDCTDPSKAFCVDNVCVGCQASGANVANSDGGAGVVDAGPNMCVAPTAVCDTVSGRCVGCTADPQCTSPAHPICDLTKNACTACTADTQCKSKSPALPACRADGQCVQCTASSASTSCSGASPVCDTTTNTCVQCMSATDCSGATPMCGSGQKCQACATDGECASLNDPARAACAAGGVCVQCTASNSAKCAGAAAVCNTTTNTCVQCLTNASCSGSAPICATASNTCRACAAASDCAGFAGHTACAVTGACVQCKDNTTCSGTTPICATATNACRKCAADSECTGIGPAVCMLDGHCAADAETVYVGTLGSATCSDNTGTGTFAAPVCSAQGGVVLAKSGSKPVVAIRGTLSPPSLGVTTNIAVSSSLTIVGRNSAVIVPASGADGLTIASGEIYLRGISIQGTATTGVGINAAPTGGNTVTLHTDTCTVSNNGGGGILLNGAAFDIKNTTITGNGPGTFSGGFQWGGVLIQNTSTSGPTTLNLVTVQNNSGGGLTCSSAVTGTGVLATGNALTVSQIGTTCGFGSCSASDGGTGCGAP